MQPKQHDDLAVDRISDKLAGLEIALCVTGGIASIESPKTARHLRRHGASVTAYMTSSAGMFIGSAALEWATARNVVTQLSGIAEHICLADAVIVAPATLNTINKIFCGIADNPVTTLVASALGRQTPVYLVPTMHESLYNNPILKENLAKAYHYGIRIIEPRMSEGKAKIPSAETIAMAVYSDILKNYHEADATGVP